MNNYNPYIQQRPSVLFAFVNGIDDAKAFILAPNQTAYLKDNNSTYMYEKRADNQGRYTLDVYELVKLSKDDDYVKKSDLDSIKSDIAKIMEALNKNEQSA